MEAQEKLTYDDYVDDLVETFGDTTKRIMLHGRLDALFAPKCDLYFVKRDFEEGVFLLIRDRVKDVPEVSVDITSREFATLAHCVAMSSEYTNRNGHLIVGGSLYRMLCDDLSAGIIRDVEAVTNLINYGKKRAVNIWKDKNYREMGKAFSVVAGRQTTDWKNTYNVRCDYNTSERLEKRFIIGMVSLRILEFIAKHEEILPYITKHKLRNLKLMAAKAEIFLEAFKAENDYCKHGAFDYAELETDNYGRIDPEGKVQYRDGTVIRVMDFYRVLMNRGIPYIVEDSPERDFSRFDKHIRDYGYTSVRKIYDRAAEEIFSLLFRPAEKGDDTKDIIIPQLEKPSGIALLLENRANAIVNTELENFRRSVYSGPVGIIKLFFHVLFGKYKLIMKAAESHILLHGGEVPEEAQLGLNGYIVRGSSSVKEYAYSMIDTLQLGWEVGRFPDDEAYVRSKPTKKDDKKKDADDMNIAG